MSTKRKPPTKIAQPVVKPSAKQPLKAHINEADTAVSAPGIAKADNGPSEDVIEISSDSSSSEYEEDDEQGNGETSATSNGAVQHDEHPQEQNPSKQPRPIRNENVDVDMEMPSPNHPTDGESDQEPTAPTFGDLVRANETIDVPSALSVQQNNALTAPARILAPPSTSSLGTVLTQALRTDDADLLESCLHTTDLATVCNTIQRLDSTLAGTLLTKLASRMHRRPGRAGSLMTWVQWTLIAHGGALATQPGLVKKLSELHRVLEERSRGLNSLLTLKGKLDLLDAQMQLRRGMQRAGDSEDENEDGEEGVVYVEGEDSDAEIVNGNTGVDDDELPVTNGIADAEDDESDENEEYDSDEDDGAEELEGEEELDENDVNHEDVESEEEDSEAEAPPPSKRSRTAQVSKRR